MPSLVNLDGVHALSITGVSSPTIVDGVTSFTVTGGGGSVTLETNGVTNGDQALLNLAAGTNVTLTDNGSGTITIAAAGGSGIALKTNNTNNASQTVLNLTNGSNITVTDAGAGAVTIALSGTVPIARGGTGTSSTLTGLVRGSASSMTAAELSGDVTTSGSNTTTLATVNSNVGSFTNTNITVNAKGLITAAANGSVSSITLKTNGANNGSQTTLNLAAGTNVTLADNGTGTVTIASTGGSGVTLKTNGVNNGSQTILNLVAGSGQSLTDNGSGSVTIASSNNVILPQAFFNANDTGSFATLSNAFVLLKNVSVIAIYAFFNNQTIGNIYSAFIATINTSGTITGTLASASTPFTTTAVGVQTVRFALSSPATIAANQEYIVALVVTNGLTTTPCRALVSNGSYGYTTLPLELSQSINSFSATTKRFWYTQTSASPSSGTPVSNSTANSYGLGFELA